MQNFYFCTVQQKEKSLQAHQKHPVNENLFFFFFSEPVGLSPGVDWVGQMTNRVFGHYHINEQNEPRMLLNKIRLS